MFRRKEKQSLLEARTRALVNAERKIEDRNILIANMERQAEILYKENKELGNKLNVAEEIIDRIIKLANANKYNNEKIFFNKIIELVHDYQSTN